MVDIRKQIILDSAHRVNLVDVYAKDWRYLDTQQSQRGLTQYEYFIKILQLQRDVSQCERVNGFRNKAQRCLG
ncbi:hypothetical protein C5167_004557 [Papaver somniferum]|uniref:Uncharacterized protein n=1 Tax=Papaver somniferum TaxID=3469 RepID=A0A4Y7JB09_PAPSO|nr:hypothetical protein C5167_004557 [Papaver somniferum]